MRYLYATMIAAVAIAPQRVNAQIESVSKSDVTQIQALVARALSDTPSAGTPPAAIVLDLQRTLGDTPDRGEHNRVDDLPALFATTPLPLRAELLTFPLHVANPEPETATQGFLQRRGGPLPPPPARRSKERYRMNLMPHAPPVQPPYGTHG